MILNQGYHSIVIKNLLSITFIIGLLFVCIPPINAQTLSGQDLIESNIILQSQTQILVQYKDGYTPQEVLEKVEKRESVASQPILGSLRIAAEDTILNAQGIPQPEKIKEEYEKAQKMARVKSSRKLLKERPKKKTPLANTEVVTLESNASVKTAIETFNNLSTVEYAEQNRLFYADITPNDPLYIQEWGLPKIGAPAAWDRSTGSNQVIVGVIDSGVMETHPDLEANLIGGYDFVVGDSIPNDRCGHGTHVAGTIGALSNNGIGVAGVNWNVKILSLKSLSTAQGPNGKPTCAGSTKTIADGVVYAVNNGAKVINMSLGGNGTCPPTTQQAINYARNNGAVVIVAAGNENQNASAHTPANCSGVIVVGATNQSDKRSIWGAGGSNYGNIVTISAPGTAIMSTMSTENIMNCTSLYCPANGTSMATPHVAGAAALLLSLNSSLTPDAIKNILVSSATPITTDQPIGGRLNLAAAVQQVSGNTTTNTPIPTSTRTPTVTFPPTACDPDAVGTSAGVIDFADLRFIRRELAGIVNTNKGSCLTSPSSDTTSFSDLRRARRIIAGLEPL